MTRTEALFAASRVDNRPGVRLAVSNGLGAASVTLGVGFFAVVTDVERRAREVETWADKVERNLDRTTRHGGERVWFVGTPEEMAEWEAAVLVRA